MLNPIAMNFIAAKWIKNLALCGDLPTKEENLGKNDIFNGSKTETETLAIFSAAEKSPTSWIGKKRPNKKGLPSVKKAPKKWLQNIL